MFYVKFIIIAIFYINSTDSILTIGYKENIKFLFSKFESFDFKFYVFCQLHTLNTNPPNTVSLLINQIWKWDLYTFSLNNQILTLNEFLILASKVKEFSGINTIVKSSDGFILPFEDLLVYVPNASYFQWIAEGDNAETAFTVETAQKMAKLEHQAKLISCDLLGIPRSFDPISFATFIKKNARPNSGLYFRLQFMEFDEAFGTNFIAIFNQTHDAWEPKEAAPLFKIVN